MSIALPVLTAQTEQEQTHQRTEQTLPDNPANCWVKTGVNQFNPDPDDKSRTRGMHDLFRLKDNMLYWAVTPKNRAANPMLDPLTLLKCLLTALLIRGRFPLRVCLVLPNPWKNA